MAVKHFPMRTSRALVAADPRFFGRVFGRGCARLAGNSSESSWTVSEDLKLFATTFAAGFLFVSVLIA